jgi:translation initiation factor IF-3
VGRPTRQEVTRRVSAQERSLDVNKKQTKVLEAIFEEPVRANINWQDVESLLKALRAEITEGRGSRVRVSLNGRKAVLHEPHPEKEMKKAAVRSLRGFLIEAGVGPE